MAAHGFRSSLDHDGGRVIAIAGKSRSSALNGSVRPPAGDELELEAESSARLYGCTSAASLGWMDRGRVRYLRRCRLRICSTCSYVHYACAVCTYCDLILHLMILRIFESSDLRSVSQTWCSALCTSASRGSCRLTKQHCQRMDRHGCQGEGLSLDVSELPKARKLPFYPRQERSCACLSSRRLSL